MRRTLRTRWRYLINGLYYGYPLCCILRFCLDSPDTPSGLVRGRIGDDIDGWVPCGIFHQPTTTPDDLYQEVYGVQGFDGLPPRAVGQPQPSTRRTTASVPGRAAALLATTKGDKWQES